MNSENKITFKRIRVSPQSANKVNSKENIDVGACKCCTDVLNAFEAKFSDMTNKINQLSNTVHTQNEAIMAALATQKILIKDLIHQEKKNSEVMDAFPIGNIDELIALEDEITRGDREIYAKAMTSLLKGKLSKTLTSILSTEVILDINIEGIHGKKRLKDFATVFETLMSAVRSLHSDPDKELRNAIKVVKKRHFHNVCVQKKPTK